VLILKMQRERRSRGRGPFYNIFAFTGFCVAVEFHVVCVIQNRCWMFRPAPDGEREGPNPICPKTPLSGLGRMMTRVNVEKTQP
jgi:hypothetical protein